MNRPHLLGIDDGPFDKTQDDPVPVVAVLTEGPDLVEAVAAASFAVDGPDATGFLAGWVGGLRLKPSVQAIVLGGITIAGLGVVDVRELAILLATPVLSVTRTAPRNTRLLAALDAAGLAERRSIVESSPPAVRIDEGLYAAAAGTGPEGAGALLASARGKSTLPEALRLAHLIARALVDGESRGRA